MANVAKKQLQLRFAGAETAAALLDWYDRERRDLPWRARKGRKADAYRVWLSEIMLQQTTVKAVIPYYESFLARWPTIEALAAATLDDVLAEWAGLGYYSRARNLHKCAQIVAEQFAGRFPETEEGLRELPGIGPYTAAAIAAIAFGARTTPVDGNIERVVARLFAVKTPLPAAKPEIKRLARTLTPARRAGDFAQALMDLGASVCTPKRPSCLMCPLQGECAAHWRGIEAALPARAAKPERPGARRHRLSRACARTRTCCCGDGRRRACSAACWRCPRPSGPRPCRPSTRRCAGTPVRAEWWAVPGVVAHTFTHFRLETLVYRAIVPADASLTFWADPQRCQWVARRDLDRAALPSA